MRGLDKRGIFMYNNKDTRHQTPDTRHQTPDIIGCIKYIYRRIVPAFVRIELLRFRNYEYYKSIKRIIRLKKEVIQYLEIECTQSGDTEKKEILEFLKQNFQKERVDFPYKFTKKYEARKIFVYTDSQCRLNYVLHEGKKLYFPQLWPEHQIQEYYNAMLIEQDSDSPHCYAGEGFYVEEGDVIADVNALQKYTYLNVKKNGWNRCVKHLSHGKKKYILSINIFPTKVKEYV